MNIINAIINLVNNPIIDLKKEYLNTNSQNRANSLGDALERYVKELFANAFNCDQDNKKKKLSEAFSYLGNNSNPPDAMLKNGDAIEIKKIESFTSDLALNSSYPKHKLYCNDSMLNTACRNAEKWQEKDIIYAVGVVKDQQLKRLIFVYGNDYCASKECYETIKQRLKDGISKINNLDFSSTRELGRLNRVDPLGITYLRIRGMWGIQNPWKVFNFNEHSNKFDFICIIDNQKWHKFDNTDKLLALNEKTDNLNVTTIKIQDPDNPAILKDAKLIKYYIK